MTAEKKIAHHRLTLLQVAERIRNVSEACRRLGVSRSQFYEYKRAYQNMGRRPIETLEAGKLVREQRIMKEAD